MSKLCPRRDTNARPVREEKTKTKKYSLCEWERKNADGKWVQRVLDIWFECLHSSQVNVLCNWMRVLSVLSRRLDNQCQLCIRPLAAMENGKKKWKYGPRAKQFIKIHKQKTKMMTKQLQKIQISDDRLEYYLNGQITCCASALL